MKFLEALGAGVESLISAASPERAARREAARVAIRNASRFSTASWDSARATRRWADRISSPGSADADLPRDTLATLRERSRDLFRNDALARASLNSLVDNIVGTGLVPRLSLDFEELGISRDQARRIERQASRLWREWSKRADSTNRLTMDEIQGLVLGSTFLNGDVFVRPIMATDMRVPSRFELKLEVIEADRVDTPDTTDDPRVRNGVILGKSRGQPIGYWIADEHPGDLWTERTFRRIPAHNAAGRPNVLHVFATERPGQSRGIPLLATVLDAFKDLGDYREAELVAAQVASCFAAFIKRPHPLTAALARATDDTKSSDLREEELNPGAIYYLDPGEEISFGNPTRPNAVFEAFIRSVSRSITASLGIPYEVASRDFSGTTYSQARSALLEARRMFSRRQIWLRNSFLQPVFEMVLEEAWLKGLIEIPDFYDRFDLWTSARWITPGWGWVDPVKEAQAEKLKLEMGVTTRSKIVASNDGGDWSDVARQLEEENEILEEIGGTGVESSSSSPKDGESDPSAGEDQDEDDAGEESATEPEDEKVEA